MTRIDFPREDLAPFRHQQVRGLLVREAAGAADRRRRAVRYLPAGPAPIAVRYHLESACLQAERPDRPPVQTRAAWTLAQVGEQGPGRRLPGPDRNLGRLLGQRDRLADLRAGGVPAGRRRGEPALLLDNVSGGRGSELRWQLPGGGQADLWLTTETGNLMSSPDAEQQLLALAATVRPAPAGDPRLAGATVDPD
jgi:hypothetical protein